MSENITETELQDATQFETQTEVQLTPQAILKSKKNFEEYAENYSFEFANTHFKESPEDRIVTVRAELTQSSESLCALLHSSYTLNADMTNYLLWFIVNEKEELVNSVKHLNSKFKKGFGIYLSKAFLNEDRIDFEILSKPEGAKKANVKRNLEAPSKVLQLKYWQKYFEICDGMSSDMQIAPAPQHWQTISIGKAGVSITPTINTKEKYVACELLISNDKSIFYSLAKHQEKIEKVLGQLDWQELDGKKSSRIRQILEIDITDEANFEEAIKAQIQMAEAFKAEFKKYL